MTHDKAFANICAFLGKYRLTAHTKLNGTVQLRDKATRRVLSKPELRARLKGK